MVAVCLLHRHDLLVPLSRTTIPLLPNIVIMPLLKMSQLLHDFVNIKCTHAHHYVGFIYKMSARNAVYRVVSGSK